MTSSSRVVTQVDPRPVRKESRPVRFLLRRWPVSTDIHLDQHGCEANMNELTGKVALVTGGSRGIGAAISRRLAQAGAAVAFTYVSAADKAQTVAKQIDADGGRVLVIRADNADPGAVSAAVEHTVQELGGIDILVNNAGVFDGGPLEEMTVARADRLWAVDVRAVFVASQAAARYMTEGGRIITIGSALAERVPLPGMTLYSMAKSALTGLTRGLARDLGPRGITVALVHGGLIDTDMNPADGPAAGALSTIPALGRFGLADEIARTVVHLAGDGGRYVTGTAITIDGGFAA
jgi:3-oxoacyl-[acyl-carrier protein] reductase